MHAAKRQSGAIALILVVVVVALLALLLSNAFLRGQAGLDQERRTTENLRRISDALVAYASLNQRLPCPAAGANLSGDAAPAGPAATCTEDAGVVPWRSLALRKEDALDGWGHRISYRVYSGATGLSRAGGVNVTDCNTNATATGLPVGSCDPAHPDHPSDFYVGKGLTIDELGTPRPQLAFVLTSHGESGKGAYGAETTTRNEMPAAGSKELDNTLALLPPLKYWIIARSAGSVPVTDVTHFDDTLGYMTIENLVVAAKLNGRSWVLPTPPTFTHAAAAAATGTSFNFNTNTNVVVFGASTATTSDDVIVTTRAANRNVSVGNDGSGNEGLGSILDSNDSQGAATISTGADEGLGFTFPAPARYLGITLVDFGTGPLFDLERAQIVFFSSGAPVGAMPLLTACNPGTEIANFTLSPGAGIDFNQIALIAQPTNVWAFSSNFLVGAITTCGASVATCVAPGAILANNCP